MPMKRSKHVQRYKLTCKNKGFKLNTKVTSIFNFYFQFQSAGNW